MPKVCVEFFGVARSRARTDAIRITAATLQDVMLHVGEELPELADLCLTDGQLTPAWLLNVNGTRFTRDLTTPLEEGDSVLLIPADAGG